MHFPLWIQKNFVSLPLINNQKSDIDILILPDKSVGLFKLSGMHLDLQELLNLEVDLVTVKGLMPFARESADRDKILIYERAS